MNNKLKQDYYVFVDNFITPNRAVSLYNNFKQEVNKYPQAFVKDPQCPSSFSVYNYKPFLILLCEQTNFMTEFMGEPMLPSYSYARLYQKNEVLKKHKDRPSCEISVSLHLNGDSPWDIWFTKPNGEKISYNLKPGQAVIYQGMLSEHGRDVYQGNNYGQVFLHYVRAEGEHWEHFFDRINNGCSR